MSAEQSQQNVEKEVAEEAMALQKTSDVYRTSENLPDRFEHPGSIASPGNPVFTFGASSEAVSAPSQNEQEKFQGYGNYAQHIMYNTTNMKYGSKGPSIHTVPTSFHCRSNKFSEHLGKCGMYLNESFNTATDKSKV